MSAADRKETRRIVLVGASVGKMWDFASLPSRVGIEGYEFEYVAKYSFDKSEEITSILGRSHSKPYAIIIKECAAFFPGDFERYCKLVELWVSQCRAANVIPILATVVPVTRTYPLRTFVLELLHGRISYPEGTQDAIVRYNDWIREFARREGIPVLDLESAVRRSDRDRHLSELLAKKDGLHLRAKAYRRMDELVRRFIEQLEQLERNRSS